MGASEIKTALPLPKLKGAILCGSMESLTEAAHFFPALTRNGYRIAGLVARDASGLREIAGATVLGADLDARAMAQAKTPVSIAILHDPAGGSEAARLFLQRAADLALRPMLLDRRGKLRRLRVADLVGAAMDLTDTAFMRAAIAGKRVMVTGAGGSIGSEICRQLVDLWPARLTLLDSSEFNLYSIDHELAAKAPDLDRGRALCDVRDGEAVARWFTRERPDIVLHVAALKHVPLVEEFPGEGALTNVLGTRNVADAAAAHGAQMMLVSTDKAVRPTGAMGATKRAAEMLCQAYDRRAARDGGSHFVVARLGNVLGSAGSVSPMFEKQIAAGGPVTITDPETARYFITIPQAASFLLRALATGLEPNAPRGAALVLDMGAPLHVIDLARDMIRLKGLRPETDVAIKIVGLRPGEKLIEQLVDDAETIEAMPADGMMAAHSAPHDLATLRIEIDRIVELAREGKDDLVRARLQSLVHDERLPDARVISAVS